MSDVPQDCFAKEDNLTDAEREVERWAAAVRMWGDREMTVPPTLLASIPGAFSGNVDGYRLHITCTCGTSVPYPTNESASVCPTCSKLWSLS